jgi:DNA anti-recombination protein RmuC
MKTKAATILGLAFMGMTALSCGENKEISSDESLVEINVDFEKERDKLKSELEKLESEVDQKIQELEKQKSDASSEAQDELEKMEKELKKEKSNLEKAIEDVEKASENTWDDFKSGVNKTTKDIENEWKKA